MGFNNSVTIIGNLVRDPELRFTPSGTAVLNNAIAYNKRSRDGDEDETHFFDFVAWSDLADNISRTLSKGDRVVLVGTLTQHSWETNEGDRRTKIEVLAEEVAPSLRWAEAVVTKNDKKTSGGGSKRNAPPQPALDDEPF